MKEAGFEKVNEAKRNGKWNIAYSSKTPLIVPKDLATALKENELAGIKFNEFSNSTKLRYIFWVESARKNETRRKRIIEVVKKARQKAKLQ